MKLRSYLIALVIVSLLPVLIFGGVMIVLFGRQQQAAVEEGLLNTARALSHAVDREVGAWMASLKGLATSEQLEVGDLRRFHEQATRALAAHGGWSAIVLIDLSGQQIVSTRFPFGSRLPRAGDSSILKQVPETGEPAVSDLFYGPASDRWLIAVGVPVAVNGRLKYLLTSSASAAFLTRLLQDQKIPPDQIGTIIDRNNVTIARTHDLDQHLGKTAAPIFLIRSGEAEEIVSHGSLREGEQGIAGLHRSVLAGWTVGLAVPLSTIEAPVRRSFLLAAGVGSVLLLSGILFAMILGRKIAAPIVALVQTAGGEKQVSVVREIFPRIYEVDQTARAIRDAAGALIRSEEKFRTAVEAAPNGMMMVDREGKIVMVNAQIEKSFGYPREELLGRSVDILVPERFRSKHTERMKEYFVHPLPRQLGVGRDLHGMRKDGLEFPVEIGLNPIETPNGLIALATVVDITERKQAEEKLARNLERIRALHEIDLAITSTLDLRTILDVLLEKTERLLPHVTASAVRLTDRETGELIPIACRNLPEEEWKAVTAAAAKEGIGRLLLHGDNSPVATLSVQTQGGSLAPEFLRKHGLASSLRVPLTVKNTVLGVITFFTSKEHEFSREEIEFLSTLAGQGAIAIHNAQLHETTKRSLEQVRALHEIDKAVGSTLDIGVALKVMLEQIEISLPIVSATTVRLLKPGTGGLESLACRGLDEKEWKSQKRNRIGSRARQVIETKAPLTMLNVRADPRTENPGIFESQGLVSYLGLPLIAKNEVLGVLSLYTNQEHDFTPEEIDFFSTLAGQAAIAIHNARLYEETKRQAEELEKSNKVKDEFLSVMSHELRTPLSVIMGYTGMLKEGMLGAVNPRQEEALQKVLGRAAEQIDMVNEIMQTTQLEARAVKPDLSPTDLGELLTGLKSDYDTTFDKKNVALLWNFPSEPIRITTDGAKLRQILQNLINNALKFTGQGTITISARVIESSQQKTVSSKENPQAESPLSASGIPPTVDRLLPTGTRLVELEVSDNGVGIPKEKLGRIFDKFYQVDSSETRLYSGVGLGLYIVNKFTELLGGQIDVESEVGKGTTFTVRMPV